MCLWHLKTNPANSDLPPLIEENREIHVRKFGDSTKNVTFTFFALSRFKQLAKFSGKLSM